jgi:hypothetical protein
MSEKGQRQADGVSNAPESLPEGMGGFFSLVGAEVRPLATFAVVPDSFCGIQIRCVSW